MSRSYFKWLQGAIGVATLLVVSGCASSPGLSLPQFGNVATGDEAVAPAAVQREYSKALASMEMGDMAVAEERLQRFVEAHPTYPNAYVNLAIIKDSRGDSKAAAHLLQHAIDVDGSNVFALNRLGLIQRKSGDFTAAEQSWLEATRVKPGYPYAWYNLGVLYDLYLRDLQAALDHYQRYQELAGSPENSSAADASVDRWISDLERRISIAPKTANARESH